MNRLFEVQRQLAVLDVPFRSLGGAMQEVIAACNRIVFYDCSIAVKTGGQWSVGADGFAGDPGEAGEFVSHYEQAHPNA